MTVNLYYIEGISRIDTPYFATKTSQATLSKQEEFFSKHLVQSVELSYYPPHYRNSIRFDEEDLTINDNVNYLSLEYRNKVYYYFIDNITYISESIIELEISMDVIQTYMFDIYISNGIIERKFINRFDNSNKIKRNYVRENVSRNEYVFSKINTYNASLTDWLVFIPVSKYLCLKQANMRITYDHSLPGLPDGAGIMTSYCTYIAPIYPSKISGKSWGDNVLADDIYQIGDVTDVNLDIDHCFGEWCSHNATVDMYICPFNCCKDITLTLGTGYNTITVDDSETNHIGDFFIYYHKVSTTGQDSIPTYVLAPDKDTTVTAGYSGAYLPKLDLKVFKKSQYIGTFTKNSTLATSYSSKYITQMLDENYIQCKFGSINSYTSLPLYYLLTNEITFYAAFNPSDGTRIYWVTRASDATYADNYNTVVIDNNIIHYDLKNDPWKDYVASNRGRWAAATVNTALNIFTKGMYAAQQNKFANEEINEVMSNPASYDKRYKLPKLKKKPANIVRGREQDIEENISSLKSGSINAVGSNIVTQAFQDYNIQCATPTPKQIGNVSGIGAKDGYIMYYEEVVQDFEQCAQYYHRNGFLVNEYINAKSDIFAYVFNRYYFNILKMQIPNVHLHNVIEDEDTIEAISDRLVDGVRLWNVNNTGVVIGDFQYDNVELDYLS